MASDINSTPGCRDSSLDARLDSVQLTGQAVAVFLLLIEIALDLALLRDKLRILLLRLLQLALEHPQTGIGFIQLRHTRQRYTINRQVSSTEVTIATNVGTLSYLVFELVGVSLFLLRLYRQFLGALVHLLVGLGKCGFLPVTNHTQ